MVLWLLLGSREGKPWETPGTEGRHGMYDSTQWRQVRDSFFTSLQA